MAQDMLIARQPPLAKGIDESAVPGPGTVAEAWNVETCDGTWRTRGGFTDWCPDNWDADWPLRVIAEYIPDFRYEGSQHHALITGGGRYGSWYEYIGDSIAATSHTGTGQGAHRQHYTWVQGLWRYVANDADVKYTSAMLVTNGEDPPFIYHQATSTNRGTCVPLDAIDGLSGLTCLKSPPKGRCVEVYKERFFMGNLYDGAGNRICWTGPDSALAFPMNVWPASYNLDVGDSSEIRAIKAWKEWLVIFKNNGVWALGGDGVGGVWNLERVQGEAGAGAIDCRAVCDIGDALVFFNANGVYLWSGGKIQNISHPRLQKTWRKLDWTTYSASDGYIDKTFQVLHDKQDKRVWISVATLPADNDLALIWNYGNDSWDIFGGGHWDNLYIYEGAPSLYTYSAATVKDMVAFGAEVNEFFGEGPKILFQRGGYPVTYDRWMGFDEAIGNVADVSWKIRSHPMLESEEFKLARNVIVDCKSGNQKVNFLVIADDETPETAFRKSATAYNIISSHSSTNEHDVAGTSNFQTVASGPVDIWFLPYLMRKEASVGILVPTAENKIKFNASVDLGPGVTTSPGDFIVIPEDQHALKIVDLNPVNNNRIWGTATWDNVEVPRLEFIRTAIGVNTTGRKFSLLVTNVGGDTGPYTQIAGATDYGTRHPEIRSWEIWARPIRSRRGGTNSSNPGYNNETNSLIPGYT